MQKKPNQYKDAAGFRVTRTIGDADLDDIYDEILRRLEGLPSFGKKSAKRNTPQAAIPNKDNKTGNHISQLP